MDPHRQQDKQGSTTLDRSGHTDQIGVVQSSPSSNRVRVIPHCAQGSPDDLPPLPALPQPQQNPASSIVRVPSVTSLSSEISRSETPALEDIEAEAGLIYHEGFGYSRVDPCPDNQSLAPEPGSLHLRQGREFPREIPDSQEDLIDQLSIDPIRPAYFNPERSTEPRTALPLDRRSLRPQPSFNWDGLLDSLDPGSSDMDELLTQPTTQPFLDPRRHGNNSMLSEDDECDVLCILHPGSPAAYRAVDLISEVSPQHILQNRNLSRSFDELGESNLVGNDGAESPTRYERSTSNDLDDKMRRRDASRNNGHAMDIALRLSSQLINPSLGFTFGRRAKKCDLLLSRVDEYERKISGMHFRIFLNKSGVLMLEDTSTNGTIVDSTSLRGGNPLPGYEKRRMISAGSIIELFLNTKDKKNTEILKFIVSVPSRNHAGERWGQNMANYLEWLKQTERQANVLAEAAYGGNAVATPPIPLNPLANNPWRSAPPNPEFARNLAAGSETHHHGMAWNGGEEYNVVGYIGKGAFANVYKLATKRDGELFAVKQIDKRRFIKNNVLDQKISNEMLIMRNLCHPNIVQFYDYHETVRHYYIIMEFVSCGDLTPYTNSGSTLAEYMCQTIASQICDALEYLHQSKVTHRDIKPDNILIASHEPLIVKLSDFGLSKIVTNEDEFLKTFCGTLLYCAPEIYPGYDRYVSGQPRKRTRSDDPPLRTSPYKQSVDIWAFAAVLYHLLCGNPPFEGSFDDRGGAMLENIMQTPVNYDRLKNAGVSSTGIDFLKRMLVLDPDQRSTETECLQHVWIAEMSCDKPQESEMQGVARSFSAIEEAANALDASQLSLAENLSRREIEDSDGGFNTDVDEIKDSHKPKRFKLNDTSVASPLPKVLNDFVSYPTLPQQQLIPMHSNTQPPAKNRLFGEIGVSALRSSGVLGYDAHAALQVPFKGSRDEGLGRSGSQSISYLTDDRVTSDGVAQHYLQYPQTLPGPAFAGAAPSLFGAEALVGQLNMASPESGGSVPSPESNHAPRTPGSRDPSPLPTSAAPGSKRSSQIFNDESDETTPKRARTNRPIRPSRRSQRANPSLKAGDNDNGLRKHKQNSAKSPSSSATTSIHEKTSVVSEDNALSQNDAEIKSVAADENAPEAIEAVDADRHDTHDHGLKLPSSIVRNASTAVEPTFTPPLPRLGTLTTVPGSICNTTIKLVERTTFYGRDPNSHVQHRNPMDTRVPKNALDIIFWRPGLEALMDSGKDWTEVDDLFAIVQTRTTRSIKVNGVKLTKGEGCWNFGRLYTGDIITIFGPSEGENVSGQAAEFLKFRCEFFVGLSAKRREEGSPPFVVEKEEEKYMLTQMRRSQGILGSQGSQENGKGASPLSSQPGSQSSQVESQGKQAGEVQARVSPQPDSQNEQAAEKTDEKAATTTAKTSHPLRQLRLPPSTI